MDMLAVFPGFIYSQWFVTIPKPTASFAGQTVIVTGSNIGLGFEAVRHIVTLGAKKVIIAVRSAEKGETARATLEHDTKCAPGTIEVWPLDLASYDSTKRFAARAVAELDRLDVLLENAGMSTQKFAMAEQDETTITTNVVSTFLLAALLAPKLRETAARFGTKPRLVIVSSEVHTFTNMNGERASAKKVHGGRIFPTLADPKTSAMSDRYNASKLLEVVAVRQIVADYMSGPDQPIVMNYLNPGLCHSALMREIGFVEHIVKTLFNARTTEVGSRTLVHAAAAGPDSHGQYLYNCTVTPPSRFVRRPEGAEFQRQVWDELREKLDAIVPGVTENFRPETK